MALEWSINHLSVLFIIFLYRIALASGIASPYPHPTLAPKYLPSCGTYGQPVCPFLPAAPGMTPKCATPGMTFCETNPDYPAYLIKQLVEALGFQRIIANEEQIDFNAYKPMEEEEHLHHHYHHFYGSFSQMEQPKPPVAGYSYNPPAQPTLQQQPSNMVSFDGPKQHPPPLVPQPIYIPKPQHSYNYNSYVKAPTFNRHNPTPGGQQGYFYPPPPRSSQVTQYSPADWLKRFARDLSDKHQRQARIAAMRRVDESVDPFDTEPTPFRLPAMLLNETSYEQLRGEARAKRQTAEALREPLCSVREKYITPQTALNTKGNWMFVVNQENSRQLVKTEVCSSTECSNLCSFPIGYSSRCEQRYVQKRLLTLDPSGRTLYVDTYWFPSCCVCSLYSGN
ncbi:protein spaetzle 5-like [Anopheles ziemanni]|uniref:protein spaetzle 5-like n=1 Tax=Anopheles coustani TaxID=139045 RepID=UPI002658BC3F|nr:protein spaetzle 5-like [Anopheles coustani]XP_058178602.1 protein spaetzle 5-like [Anopheles ziemanni]